MQVKKAYYSTEWRLYRELSRRSSIGAITFHRTLKMIMLDEHLERIAVENAILKGKINKRLTRDKRGIRYRIEGPATDDRMIHVICRFKEDSNLIIVTLYALTEEV